MVRKPDYKGNIGYTHQPIAGVTLYQERKSAEPTLEELIQGLDKSDIQEKRKEELLAKLDERIAKIRGKKEEMATAGRNLKRYLVDPETGKIDIDEAEGDYTYKDALLISASVKGKGGHFEEAISLIKTVMGLGDGKKPQADERPKNFYVDPQTGVIIHDPDNGENTLSEARAISQSMRGPTEDKQKTIQFLNDAGELVEAPAGQPIIITKKEQAHPAKTFFVNEAGELTEQEAGKPIIIKVQGPSGSGMPMLPFPVMGSDGQPVLDKEGKPVYANLEPMMKYMAFQSEQRRADESHKTKLEIATEFKSLLGKAGKAFSNIAEGEEEE